MCHKAHSTLKFNLHGEDLAKERKQILDMTKLLVEKARKCYKVQVNSWRREVEYEVAKTVLLNVNNFILSKVQVQN